MPRIHTSEQDQAFGRWLIDMTDVTVARLQSDVVGFLARRSDVIHALYVAFDMRGQGIGQHLLDHAKAHRHRLQLWTFQANTGARHFYENNGFREKMLTDGQGNDEKLPDVQMIWSRN